MGVTSLEIQDSLTVEDVLEKLGGFSRFQIFAALILAFGEAPCAAIALTMVFTGSRNVEFKCVQNDSFYMISANDPNLCNRNCTLELDLTKPIVSIVQEWELVCDRAWLPDFFTSVQMAGMTVGSLLGSQLADAWGRKPFYFASMALMGIGGLVSGVANDLYLFGGGRFVAGIGTGAFYGVYYIYLMEFLTPKWRTLSGCINVWSLGIMMLALLAYLISSWRYLTSTSSIMALAFLGCYPFIPETPRWLFCKERTTDAEKTLNCIAKFNQKPRLEPAELNKVQETVLKERNGDEKMSSICRLEVFTNAELRSKFLIFGFGWYSLSTVYYSMSFNTKNLSGDQYLNVFYMGLVDFPAFLSGSFFNNWLGRRMTYAVYMVLASILLVALVVIELVLGPHGNDLLISILTYCGRFGISGAWGVVCCFTAESFPTSCRSTALGLCLLIGNVAGIMAPQLVYLGSISPSIPYFIFAGMSLATACSTFLLKETNKLPLENFAK